MTDDDVRRICRLYFDVGLTCAWVARVTRLPPTSVWLVLTGKYHTDVSGLNELPGLPEVWRGPLSRDNETQLLAAQKEYHRE
jgi:hypothetical protein